MPIAPTPTKRLPEKDPIEAARKAKATAARAAKTARKEQVISNLRYLAQFPSTASPAEVRAAAVSALSVLGQAPPAVAAGQGVLEGVASAGAG